VLPNAVCASPHSRPPIGRTLKDSWCEKAILGANHYDNFCESTGSMMVLYVGLAKRLGVHPSHVSKVAAGKTISAEVSRALQKELQRIERM